MKSSVRNRLEQLARRLVEIDALLAEPQIAGDMDRFRKLSRERAELEPVVEVFRTYVGVEADIDAALEMMADPDLKYMADEIGRRSCRERVCQYVKIAVVSVELKKKNTEK